MSQGEDNTGSGLSGEINIILFASLGISFLQEKEEIDHPLSYCLFVLWQPSGLNAFYRETDFQRSSNSVKII